jgi:hypothetical protein
MIRPAHHLTSIVALYLITVNAPAVAGTVYALAEVGGNMDVRVPVSTSWPFGSDTADAQAGIQIDGKFGGTIAAGMGKSVIGSWRGTLAANGGISTTAFNRPGVPAPTGSSVSVFPFGILKADRPGGTVSVPTAGYFGVVKKTNFAGVTVFEPVARGLGGNTMAVGSGRWNFSSGIINNDWDGVMSAKLSLIDPKGPNFKGDNRAVGDVSDPSFFYLPTSGTPLTFQVALSHIHVNIEGSQTSGPGQLADVYYQWTVTLGAGEVPGENIIYATSGGQNFTSLTDLTLNPGTVVNYDNTSLAAGVYWMTADFTGVAQVSTPEPTTWIMMLVGSGGVLFVRLRNIRRPSLLERPILPR